RGRRARSGRPAAPLPAAGRREPSPPAASRGGPAALRRARNPRARIPGDCARSCAPSPAAACRSTLRGFQGLSDGPGYPAPAPGLDFELLPPRPGQPVVLRAAVVLGRPPERGNPPLLLDPVQGGEQRSRLHHERAAGDLLDASGDSEPVLLAGDER